MDASKPTGLVGLLTTSTAATLGACIALVAGTILTTEWAAQKSADAAAPARALVQPVVAQIAPPPALPIDAKIVSPQQRQAFEQIIREYLIANPEVLLEASKELENRQAAQAAVQQRQTIVDKKTAIFRAPTDFVMGDPNGDITVVEFFDYNCGWCKRGVDELVKLTKADPKLRIVLKELPIFGENSQAASKAAMAAIAQGKYWDFHVALMKERQVTKDNLFKIAEKVGLDIARLKKDMEDPKIEEALKETQALATALAIEGTPGFIIDSRVNVGFLPASGILGVVSEVRKAGCQIC